MVLAVALLALGLVFTGPIVEAVAGPVGLGNTAVDVWEIAKWPVMVAIFVLIVDLLYYGTLGGLVALLVWLWISNLAILFGHQLNAERERSAEIEEGTPRAEQEIQLEPRAEPQG
jgi:membrane protein